MPKIIQNVALQKVQLSETVHHWTPDGPYGSKDLKFPINVPTDLHSFDVGFLIATIFGKLNLPKKVGLKSGHTCLKSGPTTPYLARARAHVW